MPGVVGIITEKDIKGTNRVREAAPDKPLLIEDMVRSYGDPIAIVAAEDPRTGQSGRRRGQNGIRTPAGVPDASGSSGSGSA